MIPANSTVTAISQVAVSGKNGVRISATRLFVTVKSRVTWLCPKNMGFCWRKPIPGIRQVGYFVCGDPLLNALFSACIQTQKNNALGQLVDCPHREQAQYLADADLQAESLLYHFDVVSMVEKVLTDFTDGNMPMGPFHSSIPAILSIPIFRLKYRNGICISFCCCGSCFTTLEIQNCWRHTMHRQKTPCAVS